MPKYDEDDPKYFTKVYVPMSSYMFPIYKEIRKDERNRDTKKVPKVKKVKQMRQTHLKYYLKKFIKLSCCFSFIL